MTILRSREIQSAPAKKRRTGSDINPSTPARILEPSVHHTPVEIATDLPRGAGPVNERSKTSLRRRSLRLASKCDGDEKEVSNSVCGKRSLNVDDDDDSLVSGRFLSLRSGKRVAKRGVVDNGLETEPRKLDFESGFDVNLGNVGDSGNKVNGDASKEGKSGSGSKRKRACTDLVEESIVIEKFENSGASGLCGDNKAVTEDIKLDSYFSDTANEEKGKAVIEDSNANEVLGELLLENSTEVLQVENKNKGKGIVEDSFENKNVLVRCTESYEKPSSSVGRRKYTWEEKGKGIMAENVSTPIVNEIARVGVEEMEIENSSNNQKPPELLVTEISAAVYAEQTQNHNSNEVGNVSRTRQFRDIAKRNASKFAYFDAQMEEEEDFSDKEVEEDVEDWPGPFSTAMKIIKDREDNTFLDIGGTHLSNKERSSTIIWTPKINYSFVPPTAPSLQELSLRVLVKNADAITSLDYIPDALRVKICDSLCYSRRINEHFLDLLVRGSPTSICVPDCSWLTEEQFTECFKNCDTSNLTVLQLDQGGNCMPDYILHCTLARSPNNLPMLSSLSLTGAYRLSDAGLQSLVSAAPAIRSINLSQCSLLTSSSIDMLSNSLGSLLSELYINECQNIDVKLIQSALIKFEKLEVLSLADLSSVRGHFLREFITSRGQTLKQLILTNSVKLTDSFVKVISENCPNLRVLDLANVCKLTDSALGFLSNGCQALEKLIFCRNSFSDEAVAAFVETAGSSLEELSLNNVKKVGHNTALALAKHSKKLQILDVSWCRDMSDDLLGYIVDNCSSLKLLKIFGCTQVTEVFVKGHSNPTVKILGLKMDPFLDHLTKSFA